MKIGDLVIHTDGTIGIVLETKEAENSIFVKPEDKLVARVLWSDGEIDDRWYGIEIEVINENR
mgnify:CR=1 FL=1